MSFLHDEEDGPEEPIPGLPEKLPEGESILWQGRPDVGALAVHAFHVRFVTAYFVGAALWRAARAADGGALASAGAAGQTLLLGGVAVAVLWGVAYAMARAAVFTITDKRIVMRYGAAIRKYVNLPFKEITRADLKRRKNGNGDIAVQTSSARTLPYLHLWPFARPLRFSRTTPLLRAVPNAGEVAQLLARAVKDASPDTVDLAQPGAEPSEPTPAKRATAGGLKHAKLATEAVG